MKRYTSTRPAVSSHMKAIIIFTAEITPTVISYSSPPSFFLSIVMVSKVILALSHTINYHHHHHHFLSYFWHLFSAVILNYTMDFPHPAHQSLMCKLSQFHAPYNYSPNAVLLAHIKMHKHHGIFYTKQ
jgi:hypothetical protein